MTFVFREAFYRTREKSPASTQSKRMERQVPLKIPDGQRIAIQA